MPMPETLATYLRPYDRSFLDGSTRFASIGDGEIGGKAAGLLRLWQVIQESSVPLGTTEMRVDVPRFVVLTTEVFDSFMEENSLWDLALSDESDRRKGEAFVAADMPPTVVGDLWSMVSSVKQPLAVRSSSLLEDARNEPFAGIYETKMVPNNHADPKRRFQQLMEAIKLVWASTFFAAAREYHCATSHETASEKMAVLIQEVLGKRCNDRFYPEMSGVARSFNYYPFGHGQPEDGVMDLALGLGRMIVDEGVAWTVSPAYPRAYPPAGSLGDLVRDSQTDFWAIDMSGLKEHDPISEVEHMNKYSLADAEYDDTLRHVASTYDAAGDRLYMGTGFPGARVLTFAPVLLAENWPVVAAVRKLLELSEKAMGGEVEMEFAVTFGGPHDQCRLGVVQVRPMVVRHDVVELADEELSAPNALVSSRRVLGNGVDLGISHVLYVRPETFEGRLTPRIAMQIRELNRSMKAQGLGYVLVGFGRWGSTDPWLGIPVTWGEISQARCIVESTLENMNVDLSQGSHFFHNICSFKVSYFSVRHGENSIDWEALARMETVLETELVRCVRTPKELVVKVDGRTGQGVILR